MDLPGLPTRLELAQLPGGNEVSDSGVAPTMFIGLPAISLFTGIQLRLCQLSRIDINRLQKAMATNLVIDSLNHAINMSLVGTELFTEVGADRSASGPAHSERLRRTLCERPLVLWT